MMKNIYVVIQVDMDGMRYAVVDKIHVGTNLITYCKKFSDVKIIHLCEGKTQAQSIAKTWNENFKEAK